jgi:predicted P-loop ATPase
MTTAANGQHNFRPRESMFKRALSALASETTFDPVIDRIAAAQASWDGSERLDSWLASAIGEPNDAYLRAVGRNLIGGIVKRARKPGAKHDEVVILIGPQDTLKSTLCRTLAMQDDWFTDSVAFEGSPQNIVPQLFGKLVVELAELDGMAQREVNYIKRFLSAQSDNVTLKYEAFASDHARRCVFVGSSNEDNPLRDATGNRRFLPIRIDRKIDVDFVRANIDQIFGEAAALESGGELFLIPADVLPEARARQEAARAESDFEIHLASWFSADAGAAFVLPADLATLLKDATGRSVSPNAYGTAMRRLGFFKTTGRVNGAPAGVWVRGAFLDARRYEVQRDMKTGRAYPKVMFPALVTMPSRAGQLPKQSGATQIELVKQRLAGGRLQLHPHSLRA